MYYLNYTITYNIQGVQKALDRPNIFRNHAFNNKGPCIKVVENFYIYNLKFIEIIQGAS